jgi:hypothetical protein
MCSPTLLATAVVASGAADFLQASQGAKAQNKWQKIQFERTKALTIADATASYDALRARQREEDVADARNVKQVMAEAMKASGAARVKGGAGGAAAQVLGEIARQEAEYRGGTALKKRAFGQQTERSAEAVERQAKGRIMGAQVPEVPMPNFFASALRIGTQAYGAYDSAKYRRD